SSVRPTRKDSRGSEGIGPGIGCFQNLVYFRNAIKALYFSFLFFSSIIENPSDHRFIFFFPIDAFKARVPKQGFSQARCTLLLQSFPLNVIVCLKQSEGALLQ